MSEKHIFLIKPSIFQRSKLLTITPTHISYGYSNGENEDIRIEKEEIDAYKFGGFYGYDYINMHYAIQLRTLHNKVFKIKEYSFFCIRKKKFFQKYNEILQLLYKYYFQDIVSSYIELFNGNIDFEIEGAIFSREGVQFSNKSPLIKWDNLNTSNHKSYFAISSKQEPTNYKAFSYMDDWNTSIVRIITRSVVHHFETLKRELNN